MSKKFEDKTDKKEKWYGTDYSLEDIPDTKIEVKYLIFVQYL